MTSHPLALAFAVALAASGAPVASTPTTPSAPAASADANANARTSAPIHHLPGEEIKLDVSLGFFKAGEARITVGQPDGEVLPVALETRTTGLAGLFKLRSGLVSYLDRATGLPRASRLEGVEPGYRHVDTAEFDRQAGIATVREVGRFDNTYRIEVPPGTLDFVALVFRLRTLPLVDGETHEFQVLSGRKVSRIVAAVEGREVVETPAGDFPAVKVRVPTGLTGKIAEKSPTFIWFSDDTKRTVVRISADFSIGRANALLTSHLPGKAP